jgi:lysine-N-methylase
VVSVAARSSIPLSVLDLREQRYSCHGCGDCCRDFTVQLRERDVRLLQEQGWEERLGHPVTVEFRGQRFLAQRDDGACVFLQAGGLCRIHAEYGLEAKPVACQLFPFVLAPDRARVHAGISFACASVLESKGASLGSHSAEVRRMSAMVPELGPTRVLLDESTEASVEEVAAFEETIDRWIGDRARPFAERLDGLAWLGQQLANARFDKVRGPRLRELLEMLVAALPEELPLHPVEPATRAQRATLRQAAFFRLEDPKIGELRRIGRVRAVLGQWMRSRRFASGRGTVPPMGARWPGGVPFAAAESVSGWPSGPDAGACDELLTRWLRATLLGGRAWGSGYYGWTAVAGLQAMALNAACVQWLARVHGAAEGRTAAALADVRTALGRVDRTCGRAPWIGSRAELLRLRYLRIDDGLRRAARWSMGSEG